MDRVFALIAVIAFAAFLAVPLFKLGAEDLTFVIEIAVVMAAWDFWRNLRRRRAAAAAPARSEAPAASAAPPPRLDVGKLFFSFSGRINRAPFWLGWIAVLGAQVVIIVILLDMSTSLDPVASFWLSHLVVPVVALYPALALMIKRLHDLGEDGRPHVAIFLLPLVVYAILLFTGLIVRTVTVADVAMPTLTGWGRLAAMHVAAVWLAQLYFLGVGTGRAFANEHGPNPLPPRSLAATMDMGDVLFAFRGRINRSQYWLGLVITAAVSYPAYLVLGLLLRLVFGLFGLVIGWTGLAPDGLGWLGQIAAEIAMIVLAFYVSAALIVKRLHDHGRPAMPLVLVFLAADAVTLVLTILGVLTGVTTVADQPVEVISTIGWIVIVVAGIIKLYQFYLLGIMTGQAADNQYGPAPYRPDPPMTAPQVSGAMAPAAAR